MLPQLEWNKTQDKIKNPIKMKKILTFLFILWNINNIYSSMKPFSNGDNDIIEEKRQISSYENIEISGSYRIVFTNEKEGEITIKAPEKTLPLIKTEVQNHTLKIGMEDEKHKINPKTTIYIPTHSRIKTIIAKGALTITDENDLIFSDLQLDLRGSGTMKLQLKANSLQLNISGAGVVTLSGETKDFSANINGAGNLKAQDFSSEKAVIHIKGAGKATAHVTRSVEATIAGTGKINISGNPPEQKKNIKGIGAIKIE